MYLSACANSSSNSLEYPSCICESRRFSQTSKLDLWVSAKYSRVYLYHFLQCSLKYVRLLRDITITAWMLFHFMFLRGSVFMISARLLITFKSLNWFVFFTLMLNDSNSFIHHRYLFGWSYFVGMRVEPSNMILR